TGGAPVHAATADGVTQVVVRSNVPGPGTASFSMVTDVPGDDRDGNLSSDDGPPQWGLTATTAAVEIASKWYVFALYRTPADYNRGGTTTDATDPKRPATVAMHYT